MSVADILTQEIAYAFVSKEDDCGFNGDGTSTYGGIRGVTTLIKDGNHNASKVTATGHSTLPTVDATDVTKLMGTLPHYALPRAKFFCSQYAFATVFERLVAAGGGNSIATLDGEIVYRYLGYTDRDQPEAAELERHDRRRRDPVRRPRRSPPSSASAARSRSSAPRNAISIRTRSASWAPSASTSSCTMSATAPLPVRWSASSSVDA
jgi:hypothetical protein